MSENLSYSLEFQIVDSANVILTQANPNVSVPLPSGEKDDLERLFDPSAVDVAVPLLNADGVDFLLLVPTANAVFKIGATTSYPIPVKAGRAIMIDSTSIAAVYVSNPSTTQKLKVRVIQAVTRTS